MKTPRKFQKFKEFQRIIRDKQTVKRLTYLKKPGQLWKHILNKTRLCTVSKHPWIIDENKTVKKKEAKRLTNLTNYIIQTQYTDKIVKTNRICLCFRSYLKRKTVCFLPKLLNCFRCKICKFHNGCGPIWLQKWFIIWKFKPGSLSVFKRVESTNVFVASEAQALATLHQDENIAKEGLLGPDIVIAGFGYL